MFTLLLHLGKKWPVHWCGWALLLHPDPQVGTGELTGSQQQNLQPLLVESVLTEKFALLFYLCILI